MGFRKNIELLKYIKSVKISYDPFNKNSVSSKMLVTPFSVIEQTSGKSTKVELDIGNGNPAKTFVTYKDGKSLEFDATKFNFDDLQTMVFRYAKELEKKEM